jgi:hypothetical protein
MDVRLPPKLDPWIASSLLQKAIRRGEVELAQQAAVHFHRHRGTGIWRRLITIAVEDVGIADVPLILELTKLASNWKLRDALGSEQELIGGFCTRLAEAPKDRSADYVYCAATKLETALHDRSVFRSYSAEDQIAVACDLSQPLARRAVAALLCCTSAGGTINRAELERLMSAMPVRFVILEEATVNLAKMKVHPFALMLPLIWSTWWYLGAGHEVIEEEVPPTEFVRALPLYALDKHTAAGKRALERFAASDCLQPVLRQWVPTGRRKDVVGIAAFYADAAPVSRRFHWAFGPLLSHCGLVADMTDAGCPYDGISPVLEAVSANLPALDIQRRASLLRSPNQRLC